LGDFEGWEGCLMRHLAALLFFLKINAPFLRELLIGYSNLSKRFKSFDMEDGDLTYRIIGCAMKVHTKLGRGFKEYVYCRAMAIELRREGIAFEREVWLPIHYDNYRIAYRRCDFLCESSIIAEMKAKSQLINEDVVQAINTVERLNIQDGLLINFGGESLQYRHIFNKKHDPSANFTDAPMDLLGEADGTLFDSPSYMPNSMIEQALRKKPK
jgi:GxxExxY protein